MKLVAENVGSYLCEWLNCSGSTKLAENTFTDHQLVFGTRVMLEEVVCLQDGLASGRDGGILRRWR